MKKVVDERFLGSENVGFVDCGNYNGQRYMKLLLNRYFSNTNYLIIWYDTGFTQLKRIKMKVCQKKICVLLENTEGVMFSSIVSKH